MRTQGEISNQSLHLFDSEAFAKIRTLVDASQPPTITATGLQSP